MAKLAADDLVFTGANGGVLRNRNARRDWFNPAARAIAEPGLTPHDLRHTAASPRPVQQARTSKPYSACSATPPPPLTLDSYADLFDDDLDAVADRLDDVYNRAIEANGQVVKLAVGQS